MYEDTSQFSLSLASESCHDERIKSGRMCYSRHTDTIRKSSENMVFVDGKAHKLDQVTFHLPEGPPDSAPWLFTSNDDRFEMHFDPIVNRHHTNHDSVTEAQERV